MFSVAVKCVDLLLHRGDRDVHGLTAVCIDLNPDGSLIAAANMDVDDAIYLLQLAANSSFGNFPKSFQAGVAANAQLHEESCQICSVKFIDGNPGSGWKPVFQSAHFLLQLKHGKFHIRALVKRDRDVGEIRKDPRLDIVDIV